MPQPDYSADDLVVLLMVPARDVRRWLETGRLPAHRDPATGEQRVTRDDLVAFLNKNDMPPLSQYETIPDAMNTLLARLPVRLRERFVRTLERMLGGGPGGRPG